MTRHPGPKPPEGAPWMGRLRAKVVGYELQRKQAHPRHAAWQPQHQWAEWIHPRRPTQPGQPGAEGQVVKNDSRAAGTLLG